MLKTRLGFQLKQNKTKMFKFYEVPFKKNLQDSAYMEEILHLTTDT